MKMNARPFASTHSSVRYTPGGSFLFLILVLFAVSACERPRSLHQSQWIMGTIVEISWIGLPSSGKVVERAFEAIKSVDHVMNPDKPGSELARINAHAGKGPLFVSPFICKVIHEGLCIGRETGGAFDITMGPLIRLWGWDTPSPHLPPRNAVMKALKKTGIDKVVCDPTRHQITLRSTGMALDLGGIAKGFAVDRAAKVLISQKIHDFIVNAGGDLYAAGAPPGRKWRIGIQDPDDPKAVFAIVPLSDRAIATSGDYERYFFRTHVRYHHILDPKTGYPARGLRSVSVLAKTTMEADALATALFVLGKGKAIRWLAKHPEYQAVLVDDTRRVYASRSLKPVIEWKRKFEKHATFF